MENTILYYIYFIASMSEEIWPNFDWFDPILACFEAQIFLQTLAVETDRKLFQHNILPNISTEYSAETE